MNGAPWLGMGAGTPGGWWAWGRYDLNALRVFPAVPFPVVFVREVGVTAARLFLPERLSDTLWALDGVSGSLPLVPFRVFAAYAMLHRAGWTPDAIRLAVNAAGRDAVVAALEGA